MKNYKKVETTYVKARQLTQEDFDKNTVDFPGNLRDGQGLVMCRAGDSQGLVMCKVGDYMVHDYYETYYSTAKIWSKEKFEEEFMEC